MDWQIKKLGEIILENKKSSLRSKGNEIGIYPFFVSGFNIKKIDKYLINDKSIFLPTGGNFFVHYFNGKAAYSTDTWSIKTKENADIKYLYYFLIFNQDFISKKLFKGATIKHLQKEDFRNIKIPLPSFSEQKRIVKILDEVFERIEKAKENAEKNLKNSKELFESYLQSVFANPGKDWEEKKLGEICSFVRGPFGGSLKKSIFKKGGYVVYEQQHAIYNQFNDVRYFIDEKKFDEMKRFELNSGDLIMSCSGTMGKIAVAPDDLKRGIINQALLKLSPNKNIFNVFLKYWMESRVFQDDLKIYTKGAAIKNVVSVKILKEIQIILPKIEEQKSIVKKLDILSEQTKKLEAIYQKKLTDLEELKKSVLKKAFDGEL